MKSFERRTRPHGVALIALALGLCVLAPGFASAAKSSKSSKQPATRTEHDLLGEKQVPASAYYGVQTMRGLENFQLSGIPINHYPGFMAPTSVFARAAASFTMAQASMNPG